MRAIATASLVLLAGCYDFFGERGEVGFATSLLTGTSDRWTPERGVVGGSAITIAAACVADDREPDGVDCDVELEGEYRARGLDSTLELDGDDVNLVVVGQAGDRGVVSWDDGTRRDHFRVRYEAPEGVTVSPADSEQVGDEGWAVLDGELTAFELQVLDGAGEVLGYNPDQIWVSAESPLSVRWHTGHLVVAADGEDGEMALVTVGHDDRTLGTIELRVTDPDAIDGWETLIVPDPDGGEPTRETVAWVDGWALAPALSDAEAADLERSWPAPASGAAAPR